MTDQELAERIRLGDEGALEQVFRQYYDGLLAFAVRYVGSVGGAEDVVQQLFADLWIDRARWTIRSSIRAYLYAATRNRALNVRRRGLVERDWDDAGPRQDTEALQWAPPPADEQVVRGEDLARLHAGIASLPERCRLAMQLRWRDQMSYAEIAEVLGISVKGVEIQLNRGLKALREKLK